MLEHIDTFSVPEEIRLMFNGLTGKYLMVDEVDNLVVAPDPDLDAVVEQLFQKYDLSQDEGC